MQSHLRFEGHGDTHGHGQGHDQGNCQLHGDNEGCLIMVLQAARTKKLIKIIEGLFFWHDLAQYSISSSIDATIF